MIAELIGFLVFMLIIAGLAFMPLGYFIYIYTMKDGEPFGDTEPHGDSDSMVLALAEQAVNKVKFLVTRS
jgi:hypothetical protein